MLKHAKKSVFFDLDHTLWDFDRNAREALAELYAVYRFDRLFGTSDSETFIDTYHRHNHRLWHEYHLGTIDKETLRKRRFADTFDEMGVDPALFPVRFEADYLEICPRKTHLFPYAHETLQYLKGKYSLYLISNGFREACMTKIRSTNLGAYFDAVIISEEVGYLKPDPAIFYHAIGRAKTDVENTVMIGDNVEADIRGAQNVGMEAIYFNPAGQTVPDHVTITISGLDELQALL